MPLAEKGAVASSLAVLTRPAGRNEALAHNLAEYGFEPLILPALRLLDTELPAGAFPFPDGYSLLVFVSGAAVRAYRRQCASLGLTRWPANTWVAAVGPGTDAAWNEALDAPAPAPGQRILPVGAGAYDSEHLLRTLDGLGLSLSRVLVVRAAHGRNWFAQQLCRRGVNVDFHVAYHREAQPWTPAQIESLQYAAAQWRPAVWLSTSAEGLAAIRAQVQSAGVHAWWCAGAHIVTHPRLAARLTDAVTGAGPQAMVQICLPLDTDIQRAFVTIRTAIDSRRTAR